VCHSFPCGPSIHGQLMNLSYCYLLNTREAPVGFAEGDVDEDEDLNVDEDGDKPSGVHAYD
jgi:hypothetical protein